MKPISLYTTPNQEEKIRNEIGLDIPIYPKIGEVKYQGRVVGYVDNFSGMNISDDVVIMLLLINEKHLDIIIWNRPSETELFYKILDKNEEKTFRQWARENFDIKNGVVNDGWHPVLRDECQKMKTE